MKVFGKSTPVSSVGGPEYIAMAAVYFGIPMKSDFVNGESIVAVDGGWTA